MESEYADLLNELDKMASLPQYALRRGTLRTAEATITSLERERNALLAKLEGRGNIGEKP